MLVSHSAGEYSSACWETPRGLHSIFLIHSRSSRYPRIHSESSERTRLHQRRRPRVSVTEDLNVTELQLQHEHTQHSIYSSLPVTEKTHTALYTSIHMLRTLPLNVEQKRIYQDPSIHSPPLIQGPSSHIFLQEDKETDLKLF